MKIPFDQISPEIQNGCRRPKGITCTHCGRLAKMYRKKLGAPIARFLILLYNVSARGEHGAYHKTRELYPRDNKSSTEGVCARFWGLIEVADATNSAGAPVGTFRLTDLGRRFVNGLEFLPMYVRTYNNEQLGPPEGPLTNIKESLGKKFVYSDLMKGV